MRSITTLLHAENGNSKHRPYILLYGEVIEIWARATALNILKLSEAELEVDEIENRLEKRRGGKMGMRIKEAVRTGGCMSTAIV